jgi:PAS domain S-box-containing protein
LPALILTLLIGIGCAFAWTAHREVQRALRVNGDQRISSAAAQVADLMSQGATARLAEARRLAGDETVRRFVATGVDDEAVMATLLAFGARNPQARILLTARGGAAPIRRESKNVTLVREPAAADPGQPAPADGISALTLEGGRVSYRATARVAPAADTSGVVAIERSLTSAVVVTLIQRLLGSGAILKLGNATGDLWTDLAAPVAAPPAVDGTAAISFVDASGARRLGNAVPVAGTPWRVWVEFSELALMEPARTLLRRMLPATLLLIFLGALAVAAVSARITKPLEDVANAADAIAGGDYLRQVAVRRTDEIGRLGAAFNVMAAQVAKSREALEARVQERTQQLEHARQELDQFFSMSIDLLCIAGTDGRFRRVNPAWEEVLGWTPEDLTSAPYVNLVHPDDVEATAAETTKLAQGCGTVNFENRYRCKDGSYRWLHWKSAALPDLGLIYACARDVTDQRQKARELQEHAAALTAVNRELEAFSYSVSHDLRAPLRSIDGFSLALLEDCADRLGPDGADHLRRIRGAAQNMGGLIDDLLKLARVTRADLRREHVNLSAVAQDAVDELVKTNPSRVVDCAVQPGLSTFGDPRLLKIAVTNLLDNAWKFTDKRARARIEFGAAASNGCAVYFVRDNGAGFDMKYGNKLFGTFQRLHHAGDFPGTGIGLATVQRIVARHGGRIWAEGAPGSGATFSFTLQPEPQA